MFTGLVETQGTVVRLEPQGAGQRLTLTARLAHEPVALGDSVAVNGVCLTVVAADNAAETLVFELAPETLRRTNLGRLGAGSRVNLERALRLGDRLGGHWLQGHVDGVGTLSQRQPDGDWELFNFNCPEALFRYLVPKGSIAVDGVSLTLVAVEPPRFSIALIPHTLAITTLGQLGPGMEVNLEVDLLAKYVEQLLAHRP
ncbi:MAG TPA: riboflavin synthase [Gemmatales bacterium]|nr:riboflavin synthase [Gemmatales bacterium]HMP60777.1 riboflavin synthase [Gemmatales bacterium]